MVKIVTYNVNGLRVAQHASLGRLLDALDADIICFQMLQHFAGYHQYFLVRRLLRLSWITWFCKRVDSEGRCIITAHGNFGKVLFDIYGPSIGEDDKDPSIGEDDKNDCSFS